jgi:hypothetical protein
VVGAEKRSEVCDDGNVDRSGDCGDARDGKSWSRSLSGLGGLSTMAASGSRELKDGADELKQIWMNLEVRNHVLRPEKILQSNLRNRSR